MTMADRWTDTDRQTDECNVTAQVCQEAQNFPFSIFNFPFTQPAFTLAEVLITLGIIGVVAAMTIPTLINKTNDMEFNSSLKKAYSGLSQAILLIQQNNGTVNAGIGGDTASANLMRADFASVMKVVKSDVAENIFLNSYKLYKGGDAGWSGAIASGGAAAVLSDGTFLYFDSYANCTSAGPNNTACGQIRLDINGNKGPNMYGKDMHMFFVTLNNGTYSILPMGTNGDGLSCASPSTTAADSYGCTAKRLTDPEHMP